MKFAKRIEEIEEEIQMKLVAQHLVEQELRTNQEVLIHIRGMEGVEEKTLFHLLNTIKTLQYQYNKIGIEIEILETKKEYFIYFS